MTDTDPLCSLRDLAAIAAAGICAGLAATVIGVAVMVAARKARWGR